jgi:hypothetical protein
VREGWGATAGIAEGAQGLAALVMRPSTLRAAPGRLARQVADETPGSRAYRAARNLVLVELEHRAG